MLEPLFVCAVVVGADPADLQEGTMAEINLIRFLAQ
jgi:hypothetical protein